MAPLETSWISDVVAAFSLTATLIGLGVFMAFSPTTFGIEAAAVQHTTRARQRVLVIAGGVASAATFLALLFLVINPATLRALWTGDLEPLLQQRWLDALAGVVLVVVGIIQWRRAARPRPPKRSRAKLDRPGPLYGVVLGESLLSTTGPATMYLVVRAITATSPVFWPVGYVIFLVGLVAPYVVLAVAITKIPAAARTLSRAMTALERRDLRRPLAGLALAAGVALLTWTTIKLL